MKVKRHIVWSKRELDLSDPWQRSWWVQQVLLHGRSEDMTELDLFTTERGLILPFSRIAEEGFVEHGQIAAEERLRGRELPSFEPYGAICYSKGLVHSMEEEAG